MTIAKDSAVFFNYTLTDSKGTTLDKSPEGQPLAYIQGHDNIIPGLESQMLGKNIGDIFTAIVEPAEAYGEYDEAAIQQVPRDNFQGVDQIEVGMQFQAQSEDGQVMMVAVKDVNDDTVTIDGNHPLAGKQLTFDVEITDIREATEEELEHGHIHGEGGAEH